MATRSTRVSLALGVALLGVSVARAGAEDPAAMHRAQIEQAVKTRTDLLAIIANPREGNHLDKLIAHHERGNASPVSLLSARGMSLSAAGGRLMISSTGRVTRAATADDLFRMGISSAEGFHAIIEQAGGRIGGSRETPSAEETPAAKPRETSNGAPTSRLPGGGGVWQLIYEPALNPDLDLALRAQALMSPTARKMTLAVLGEESLQVAPIKAEWRPLGHPNLITGIKPRVIVVGPESPQGREASLGDLRRFGLNTQAAFDAAAAKLVMSIAIEDIL